MKRNILARKTKNKKRRIIGRGGRHAKTAGRGTKGQLARSGRKLRPELRDIIKKIPKLRGRGKNVNKSFEVRPISVSLAQLSVLAAGTVVTPKTLLEKGIITLRRGRVPAVKILSTGELTTSLTITNCTISKKAKEAIEKAGGSVK